MFAKRYLIPTLLRSIKPNNMISEIFFIIENDIFSDIIKLNATLFYISTITPIRTYWVCEF